MPIYSPTENSDVQVNSKNTLLRPSRVLNKLRGGETVSCIKLNLSDARVVEIAALCGIDCIWLDMEHVPNTFEQIENQVRAAKAYGADTIVRVQRGSYNDLIRPLELDATGIMVPHVQTADEARQIAEQTRFQPLGLRALDGGNTDGAFTLAPLDEYIAHANTQRFVVVQIEDPKAMAQLDDIAAVEGIDMLFFGPGDFSHGLGIPGQMDDSRIKEARSAVAQAAKKHGKFAGTVASLENHKAIEQLGYNFISIGADVVVLQQQFSAVAKAFG